MNEKTNAVQLTVIRSGQFSEIYRPSVEYRITTNGSSTGYYTMWIHGVDNFVVISDISTTIIEYSNNIEQFYYTKLCKSIISSE